jgi:hypothetical protein
MSNAFRSEWEEQIGIRTMKVVPEARDSERRFAFGSKERALRTRDHAAIVYWDSSELLENVIPYLVEGLRAGDKVVYVADDHPLAVLEEGLARAGVDVGTHTSRGSLVLLTAEQAFFGGGRFDVQAALAGVQQLAEAAAREGYSRVRFSVEMTYLLANVPGIEHGPEFESRANDEIFAKFPFVCICSFNGNRDKGRALETVLATHPILIAGGIPLENPHYRAWPEPAGNKPSRASTSPVVATGE